MSTHTLDQALDLALERHRAGRLQEAEGIYRQVLAQQPDCADALHLLGVLAHQTGRYDAAIELIRRAIGINPRFAMFHDNLGKVLRELGRNQEALEAYSASLALTGELATTCNSIGACLESLNRLAEAEAAYRKAVANQSDFADAWSNLGSVLQRQGRMAEAIECYRRALAAQPNHPVAHYNMGNAFKADQQPGQAIECYQKAIALRPDFVEAWCNLGSVFQEQGRTEESFQCDSRALSLCPHRSDIHDKVLLRLHARADLDDGSLAEARRQWAERHARPLYAEIRPHANDRTPDRRLRIGYVAPTFSAGAVGRMIEPLLARHDRQRFEVACYVNASLADAITARLKAHVDLWRETAALDDRALAELIREDRIDILVDLAWHTAGNRLLVFARKPAPIQVSYLGFIGPGGLETIDYRLTDQLLDPDQERPGSEHGPEQPLRLSGCYWCYTPPAEAPAVSQAPALSAGRVRFGFLGDFSKASESVLRLWAKVLQAVPRSELMIVIAGGERNTHVPRAFQELGVEAERVKLQPRVSYGDYWKLYEQVDIGLDVFPWNGGVASMDSLWMGVPVITLAGNRAQSRAGASVLGHAGLPEFIARAPDQYVPIAVELAADLPRLSSLRMGLRERMRQSPITDAPGYAKDVEAAYQKMWDTWRRR